MKAATILRQLWLSLLFFNLLIVSTAAADYAVGEILSYDGTVFLDPFGTGDREPVNKTGKPIYRNSIIITGEASNALIRILDEEFSIPAQSRQEIASIIDLETRKKNSPWFTPLLDMVRKTTEFLFPTEENVDLVSRGKKPSDLHEELFGFNEDEAQATDFSLELEALLSHPNLTETGLSPGEYDFKKGFCYFQLGSYQDAARLMKSALTLAAEEQKISGKLPYYYNSLLLLSGITCYLQADFSQAAGYLESFLKSNGENDFTPFASWLLADTLYVLNQETQAREVLKQSSRYFTGHLLRKEFEMYYSARNP